METSLFIAKILGPLLFVIAAGIVANRESYCKVLEDYSKNSALVFFSGAIVLVAGIVVVLTHNLWVASWRVIITIYGWGGIIKGVWLIVFPNRTSKFIQAYKKHKTLLVAHSFVVLILGAVLIFVGYAAG